jgi:hypothetical protein
MGQVGAGTKITAGSLAATDPFVSDASLMAASLMKTMVPVPKPQRAAWLRGKLNGLWPNMGDEVLVSISKISEQKSRDQAIFDAIRLALANRMRSWATQRAATHGISGLGDVATDARSASCTIASVSATAGGWAGAFVTGADTSIIGGANAGAAIAGCDLDRLRLQAQIAQTQANAAAAAGVSSGDRTVLYAGLGIGGIIALAIAAKIALK